MDTNKVIEEAVDSFADAFCHHTGMNFLSKYDETPIDVWLRSKFMSVYNAGAAGQITNGTKE